MAEVPRRLDRTMGVEKKLEKEEADKDHKILSEALSALPSDAKAKIYKKDEDGRKYISSVSLEDITDPQEYIQNKYVRKYGGGDYLVEYVDSTGKAVSNRTVSFVETSAAPSTGGPDSKATRIVEEALDMRERAFDKSREVERERGEVEKTKYETIIDSTNRQWDIIKDMYTSQIENLKNQMENKSDPNAQLIMKMELNELQHKMEQAQDKFMAEIKDKESTGSANDRVFDLVNTILAGVLGGDKEDPQEMFLKTMDLVQRMTEGKKDIIESMIESPEKIKLFQKMLGVDGDDKKRGSFMEEMFENPGKMQMYKTMMGMDKKDFFTELLENPERMNLIKRMFGWEDKGSQVIAPPPPQKDILEQMADMSDKLGKIKPLLIPLLGIPTTPPRSFMEFVGGFVQQMGPSLMGIVNNIMGGMMQLEMIKQGKIPKGLEGQYTDAANEPFSKATEVAKMPYTETDTVEKTPEKPKQTLETMFQWAVATVANANKEQKMEEDDFIAAVVETLYTSIKDSPQIIFEAWSRYKTVDELKIACGTILTQLLSIPAEVSNPIAGKIVEASTVRVREMMGGGA